MKKGRGNIRQFLKGKRFQAFKKDAIERLNNECAQCGCKQGLSLYFKRWSDFTKLNLSDVIVLCKKHGESFLKERQSYTKSDQKWITAKDRKEVSFRYARHLLVKDGDLTGSLPKDLILAKQIHIKVKRTIKNQIV